MITNNFLLGTNWKMNKTFAESDKYIENLKILSQNYTCFKYFIIPPYTHLSEAKNRLTGTNILLGAQNMHWEDYGPYSGEISPLWLCDIGIDLVMLGHSERRQYYNENDIDLNKKVHSALNHNIVPLLCIGETKNEKESGITSKVLANQLKIALADISQKNAKKLLIAYEPVWAIGDKGQPATPEYVEQVHKNIRDILCELFDCGKDIPILYGGSVNTQNCVDIAILKNVDGLFIGRSAWDIESFSKISELLFERL